MPAVERDVIVDGGVQPDGLAVSAPEVFDQNAVLASLEQQGWFEGLDLKQVEKETGFTPTDVAALMATASTETHPDIRRSLQQYPAQRDAFFQNTQDPAAFQEYSNTMLTLLYGDTHHQAAAHMGEFMADSYAHMDRASWATERPAPNPSEEGKRIIYEMYVDRFAGNFEGLKDRLPYLASLGVKTIWTLPPYPSPMVDDGFDPADSRDIREELGGMAGMETFLAAAREHGITVMLDRIINHDSYQSKTFQAAIDPNDPEHARYRDWYYFRDGQRDKPPGDLPAPSIFFNIPVSGAGKEMFVDAAGAPKTSNWSWVVPPGGDPENGKWVFHSFYPQMPDRNLHNPDVLVDELRTVQHWGDAGQGAVSHIRYDAAKHVWKTDKHDVHPDHAAMSDGLGKLLESYNCERTPQSHIVLRLLKGFAQHRYQGHVRMVGEIWDNFPTVVSYFGPKGEEVDDQFGFSRMEGMMMSLIHQKSALLSRDILQRSSLAPEAGFVDMDRHHDAIAGSDTKENRKKWKKLAPRAALQLPANVAATLQEKYGYDPKKGKFFEGGLAARLRNLLEGLEDSDDKERLIKNHKLAMSLLFFTGSRPMLYMGDEWLQKDRPQDLLAADGLDMRRIHRGIDPWEEVRAHMQDPTTVESQAVAHTKHLIGLRTSDSYPALWKGNLRSVPVKTRQGNDHPGVLAALRRYEGDDERAGQSILLAANVRENAARVLIPVEKGSIGSDAQLQDIITGKPVQWKLIEQQDSEYISLSLKAKESLWIVPTPKS